MVIPYLGTYMAQERHISLHMVGVVLSVSGFGSILSQFCAGWCVDRFGYRITMTAGMAGTGMFLFLLGVADNMTMIVICTLLVGLTGDMHRPASAALVADMCSPAERPRAYGLLYWAVNLGYAVSMVTGGTLVRYGFTLLFWFNATTCLTAAALVWRAVKKTSLQSTTEPDVSSRYLDAARDRLLLAYLGSWFAYGIVFCQAVTTLPLAMRMDGLSASTYGYAMAINAIIIVCIQPLASPILTRLDPSHVLIGGVLILGAGFGCTTFVSSATGYGLTIALWTLGEIAVSSVNQAVIASFAPASLRGRYYGLYGVAWSTALLVAPILGTTLLAKGTSYLWATCAALCVLSAASQRMLMPRIRARAQAA